MDNGAQKNANNGVEIITTGTVRFGRRFDGNFIGTENINKLERG